jgi:unconventional SNARE in the endoplasmic reticulum protein 1
MSSTLEINIRSLLTNCEEMASADNKDWRLKKYIKSLDVMINEFEEDR